MKYDPVLEIKLWIKLDFFLFSKREAIIQHLRLTSATATEQQTLTVIDDLPHCKKSTFVKRCE